MAGNVVTGTVSFSSTPVAPFVLLVTSTAGISAGTTLLMTIWVGPTLVGAAQTQYVVPSGNTLRILNMQAVINQSAVTGGTVQFVLAQASASASLTQAALATAGRPIMLQMLISAGPVAASIINAQADVVAGSTVGMQVVMGTSMLVGAVIVQGYLF